MVAVVVEVVVVLIGAGATVLIVKNRLNKRLFKALATNVMPKMGRI